MQRLHILAIFSFFIFSFFSSPINAQHDHGETLTRTDTIPLFPEALGPFTRPVTTDNEEAQAYFDQGMQLKYAFGTKEAAMSFREAIKRDEDCAICYWGEAWAMGSYLNGRLSKDNAPKAYESIQKAVKLSKKHASPIEKALIKAAKVRFVEDYDPDNHGAQDTAYAEAMAEVYEQFPDDHDVATIYAEALFVLEPRRGTRDINKPEVQLIHKILEKVLDEDIQHPGACHHYIHATESTEKPELGESCADYLGNAIPGASHINHMPSHTWNETGKWDRSVRANLQAWHSDQKAKIGEGVAIYAAHNLHMLLYAASFDGQGAIAIQAARDYARSTDNTMFEILTLVRFGRFEEILEVKERPKDAIPGAIWDFGQGYAHLRTGESDFAKVYLNRIKITADTSSAKYRGHAAEHLVGTLASILEGEIYWNVGELQSTITSFEKAVLFEDAMEYDEPEPLPFSARHWLGAALLEVERYADAEKVYREALDDHPRNGWCLFGLLKALEGQNKPTAKVQKEFEESWARADHWIRTSRL
jgi:tetratricopeptide (TPR) repeat protein